MQHEPAEAHAFIQPYEARPHRFDLSLTLFARGEDFAAASVEWGFFCESEAEAREVAAALCVKFGVRLTGVFMQPSAPESGL
jgi:hypothetical protein